MMKSIYALDNTENLLTPSLIFYEDLIRQNTRQMIRLAGQARAEDGPGPDGKMPAANEAEGIRRLWPHIKTHKSLDMTRLLMSFGIRQFKAATISEAEMCCMAGADRVLLAYPLIGPNMERLLKLQLAYPSTILYGLEDDQEQFVLLSRTIGRMKREGQIASGFDLPVLIDVDLGQGRTGAPLADLKAMVRNTTSLEHLRLEGLHLYDGHRHESDPEERDRYVAQTDARVQALIDELKEEGYPLPVIIAGGTPSFPCHARHSSWYLSPGTSFIHDYGYDKNFPDLGCTPAAVVASRVVSHPAPGCFTLDCGCKAIATDPAPERGRIDGLEDAVTLMQNEEHWVFSLPEGSKASVPPIGEVLYIVPTHICPTTALYPEIQVAENGTITKIWPVTARNRKITY